MAVAVGASCAFLTPIGHQNNLLVMGPGGYRFSDYARLGAPLSLLVILLAVPMILLYFAAVGVAALHDRRALRKRAETELVDAGSAT